MAEWVLVCANGADHRDYGVGEVLTAPTEQAALNAAEFMDDEREPGEVTPWDCGPHTVKQRAASEAGERRG